MLILLLQFLDLLETDSKPLLSGEKIKLHKKLRMD